MNSIAIITAIQTLNNYGQILQAYALCTYLRNKGHDASLVDFAYDIDWETIPPISFKSRLKYIIKESPFFKLYKKHKDKCKFLQFKQNYLQIYPQKYPSYKSLLRKPPIADVYMTGSDQIWGNHIKRIEPFFLSFGADNISRIAYAPSFGTPTLSEDRKIKIKPLLSKYSAVGIREKSGVEIAKNLGRSDAKWVPDPTLLLNADEWSAIAYNESPFKSSGKKVFVYIIGNDNDERLLSFAESIPNAEIIIASDSPNQPIGKMYLSLPEWIRAIQDCDYVITNSFHGTMFSLMFNKQFLTFERIGRAAHMNVRVRSIVEITGLQNRLVQSDSDISFETLKLPINWLSVNSKLNDWKKVGEDFLTNSLKD